MAVQTSSSKHQTSNKVQTPGPKRAPFDLEERMVIFGENVIVFCKGLSVDHVSRPIVTQLVRSATSVGANYSEANNASSKKDFRNKVHIAKKEAQETKYWLRILKKCYPSHAEKLALFWQEAHELTLILQAISNKVNIKTDV